MTVTAVIAAGGSGVRFGRSVPKQFLPIRNVPMIVHTLRAFERTRAIDRIVVTLPAADLDRLAPAELRRFGLSKVVRVVPGGASRQASVGLGLEAVDGSPDLVAIHDAARCCVTPGLIERTVRACDGWDGAIAALPVRDTLKRVAGEWIDRTEPREGLWAMQTPQVFRFPFLRDAYRAAAHKGVEGTDDASLAERFGGRIRVVEGSTRNFKVTYEEDLALAELLLEGS